MSEAETLRFMQESRHAVVATSRKDGSPQISPVWFAFEGGHLYFAVHANSAKAINMRRDARIAVCIDAGHPDARSVTLYGTVGLHPDTGPYSELHARIVRRYKESDEAAERYLTTARAVSAVWIAELSPEKILAYDYN